MARNAEGENAKTTANGTTKPLDSNNNVAFQIGTPKGPSVQRTGGKKRRFALFVDCSIL